MNRLLVCAGFAAGIASGAVSAQSGQEILQSRGCLSCHDMERRKVGPAFKDVGAKYKGDKSRTGDIVARMKEGKGHPKVAGSDAELSAAVEAALSSR